MSFIVESVSDELLVYDTETATAHCLDAATKSKWLTAKTNAARRKFLVVGAVGVVSMLAPLVADAASMCSTSCDRGDIGKQCSKHGGSCDGRCFRRRCL